MIRSVSPIDRILELGGELYLNGDVIRYRIPAGSQEAHKLLAEIRKDREAVIAFLRDRESKPPTSEAVKAMLPKGVQLVSYRPKQTPFVVAPISVVTNAGDFFRTSLSELSRLLSKPKSDNCMPVEDIVLKLADAGLELRIKNTRAREHQ